MTPQPSPPKASTPVLNPLVRKFLLLAGLGAFAFSFSSCSSTSQHASGFVHTSNGITVSSTQATQAAPAVDESVDSIPMLHDTTQLFDDLGANDLSTMLHKASATPNASPESDYRTFRSLETDAR